MTGTLTKRAEGFRGRRVLRTMIWAGLAAYTVYLSSAAVAGQPGKGFDSDLFHAVSMGPSWGEMDADKAKLFEKPTPADPREEIACMALNIYHEARGEPDQGKIAVAHVVMNRVASARFPGTVCEVVQQGGEIRRHRCQFSWWCDGRSDAPLSEQDWQVSTEVALTVYWGRSDDPTAGALWYHADYVSPRWRRAFEEGPTIGRHIFYRASDKEARLASRKIKR